MKLKPSHTGLDNMFGRFGHLRNASFSCALCYRIGYGQQIGWCYANGPIAIFVSCACGIWRLVCTCSLCARSLASFGPPSVPGVTARVWTRQIGRRPVICLLGFFNLVGNSTSTEAKGARSLTILVAWSIWCERNSRIFYDAVKTPSRIVEEIKETARLWVSAGAKHLAEHLQEFAIFYLAYLVFCQLLKKYAK